MAEPCSETNPKGEISPRSDKHDSEKLQPSCMQNESGKMSQRKRVYRSIFGPAASSDSSSESDTDESNYSSDLEETDAPADVEKSEKDNKMTDNETTSKEYGVDMQIDQNILGTKTPEELSAKEDKNRDTNKSFEEHFLSPEEKEALSHLALSHIVKELDRRVNKLDNDDTESGATRLYTGPYGRIHSPFKKFSSFHGFPGGVKRSPRKQQGPASKRTKLFHHDDETGTSSSSLNSPLEDTSPRRSPPDIVKESKKDVSGSESTDEEKLEIVEDDQNSEFDRKLEDKSSKFSLTAVNVKSIIHKIVTNENVIEMVRKAVQEEMDEHELKFEPKMTRSKLKEFEAQGQVPPNWGLSPRKKRESPNFLEMELPEDEEDDEDFNPDKVVLESDEDNESVLSSCLSDIGSPMPSTPKSLPSTPTVTSSVSSSTPVPVDTDSLTMDESSSQSFLSPMGPPLQTSVPKSQPKSSGLGRKYQDAMERERQQQEEEAELIASRTRSKYPLKDCSILDIEANFVAPDITQDMYDTCDDYDWAEFLSTLIRFPGDDTLTNNLNTTNDEEDTEDDPEYNFQAEIEEFEFDQEDFRDDRAVKVSKKEVNELLGDILNDENDDDTIDEQYKITIKTQSEKIVFNSNKKKQTEYQQSLISAIGQHERRQIDDQLRKHVQQLAQTFVMSQTGLEEHKPMADTAKFYLNELSNFADRSESLYGKTAFRVCNLEPALHLLDDQMWQETVELSSEDRDRLEALQFKYDSQYLPALSYRQMTTIWNSPVFIYPELLPHGAFFERVYIKKDRARVKFLEPEDNLLAMGVAQFSHLKKDAKDYIQRFMLPCKTRKQIEIRIKNLNAKASKDNAVKFYKTYKKLPKFPQHAPEFDESMIKPLKDREHDWNELPLWCQFYCQDDNALSNESTREKWERQKEIKRRRKERQTASFSLSDTDALPVYTPPHPTSSAPVTPKQQTDSSLSGSSSSDSAVNFLQVKRKRPRRQRRKRLNMNKKNAGMGVVGSFVPLPLPGSNSSQQSKQAPLTICVLDSLQHVTPVSRTGIGNSMATCATPTIVVINKNAPLQVQSLNQTLTFTSSHTYPQAVTQFTQPTNLVPQGGNQSTQLPRQVAQTVSTINEDSMKSDSDIDGKSLTFEDICRPIMEAEMASGDVVPTGDKELCTLYTENGSAVSVKNDVIVNIVKNVSSKAKEPSDTVVFATQNENLLDDQRGATVNQNIEVQSKNVNYAVSSKTELKTQGELNVLCNKHEDNIHVHRQQATVQKEAVTSAGEHRGDGTLTDFPPADCSCTPTQEVSSHRNFNSELTPTKTTSGSELSSSEKTPKEQIEVVAALAPYFISPIHSDGSLQHETEQTPTKKVLPTLAPKSLSPSQGTAPISFTDLTPGRRKLKVKSSPRKKHLQQQVKTILPKGFVVSSFDTSPAKKAASNLVDRAIQRANHSKGFCKILPRPPNQGNACQQGLLTKSSRRGTTRKKVKKTDTVKNNSTKESGIHSQSDVLSDNVVDDVDENVSNNAVVEEEDRGGDTESDYTQSEDGNETQGTDGEDGDTQGTDDGEVTQGTDGDSQDSQEEDNLIADLMAASTTMGFVPNREDMYSRSRLGRKGRDRDLTLALLEPDIVEADPQRDLRDTLFAQAYIHKVKKALRDDSDKFEKFLKIMCHFSQDCGSPVKLYKDLQELFSSHPDLIYDFAGFLYPEQAVACGCYKAYQQFIQARTFLRKLEIYFNKNPNQLQKMMRTFSRWYKKPGRKVTDLREQIEPMLKGQKMLLEEFLRFFPNERPSESLMDDFEEINLDDNDEIEDKDTSFEEIELLDMEEAYGTKRCVCSCHNDGDDTYRKRKKHCYQCCLTVIDGELVYKVNKSTIKRINVIYGPPVKLSSLLNKEESELGKGEPVSVETGSQELVTATGTADVSCKGELASSESTSNEAGEREPENEDWLFDTATAEKENIEQLNESPRTEKDGQQRKTSKMKSPTKESFLERISKLSRNKPPDKSSRLSSVIKGKSLSQSQREGQQEVVIETESVHEITQTDDMETEHSEIKMIQTLENDTDNRVENSNQVKGLGSKAEQSEMNVTETNMSETGKVMRNGATQRKENKETVKCPCDFGSNILLAERGMIQNETTTERSTNVRNSPDLVSARSDIVHRDTSVTSEVSNDILATAFSSAINTEVSMDTSCFPLNFSACSNNQSREIEAIREPDNISEVSNKINTSTSVETKLRPTVVSSSVASIPDVLAPGGQSSLHVSRDSSFQKVPSSENIASVNKEKDKVKGILCELEQTEVSGLTEKKEDMTNVSSSKHVSKIDVAFDASKSPPFSPFSPFSPFAQEIQSITSCQSPLSAITSPGIARSLSSSGKVRRITPIPVKGEEGKPDSQSSFLTAMENSPVLPDLPISSPCENTQNTSTSVDNVTSLSSNSVDNSQGFSGNAGEVAVAPDSGSDSQKLEVSSQRSHSTSTDTSSSQTSVTAEPSCARTVISKPDIFSENANVGFPKVSPAVSHLDAGRSGLLSEESLFQCLSKPPEFTETIPNVSNLTNILHALDGHTQGSKIQEQKQEHTDVEKRQDNDSTLGVINTTNDEVAEKNVAESNSDICVKTKAVSSDTDRNETEGDEGETRLTNVAMESAGNYSSVQSSGDSSDESLSPQITESFDNLKRIRSDLFKVSRLSDSDTSGVSTPSVSATDILSKKSVAQDTVKLKHKTDNVEVSNRKDVEETAKEVQRPEKNDLGFNRPGVGADVKITGEKACRKSTECAVDSTDSKIEEKRKRHKMSRRELRRSLQGKDLDIAGCESAATKITVNSSEVESSQNIRINILESERERILESDNTVVCKDENEGANDVSNVLQDNNKPDTPQDGHQSDRSVQNVCEPILEDRSEEIKVEDPELVDCTGMSDIQSISDSVSEASSRGHKKSKRKHKTKHKSDKERSRKKKKRNEGKDSDSTPGTEKKKKKKSRRKLLEKSPEETRLKQEDMDHEEMSVKKPTESCVKETMQSITDRSAVTSTPALTNEVPSVSETAETSKPTEVQGEQVETEPEWTKETDKTILETCKTHGIKEKTFARIAKRIGHVTSKQVRKRFEQLYGIIFGRQFGDKTDE